MDVWCSNSSHPNHSNHRTLATVSSTGNNQSKNDDDDDELQSQIDNVDRPRWLTIANEKAATNTPMDSHRAYRYLRMEKYTRDELETIFQRIATSKTMEAGGDTGAVVVDNHNNDDDQPLFFDKDTLRSYLSQTIRQREGEVQARRRRKKYNNHYNYATTNDNIDNIDHNRQYQRRIEFLRNEYIEAETSQLWNFLVTHNNNSKRQQQQQYSLQLFDDGNNKFNINTNNNSNAAVVAKQDFVEHLLASATTIDRKRLWPLTLSMVMIGLSVGVTTPAFPFVVQDLGLTTGEYGIVVSAFALTKLFGNIPFAVLVERNGRKVRRCSCVHDT